MREIGVVDTTLRDGQQCLWATRMTTAMMLPATADIDETGYVAVDLMGSIQFDVCVRYLKENPWERLRLIRSRIKNTPLKAGLRSKSLATFRVLPDDLVELWVERLVVNGIRKLSPFDALFDFDNIETSIKAGRAAGADVGVALVYTISPVHTDEFYTRKAREIKDRAGITHVMLKDSGGLLTPDRVRTLVPALKRVLGNIPLELHSHCMTGLAPLVYLEGIKAGADVVHTATAPLANGPSQPATQTIADNLRRMGYGVAIDDAALRRTSDYFALVAEAEGKPVGVPLEYDAFHFEHHMPGGMITNLKSQLKDAGLLDRYNQVLDEIGTIRRELGWPIMVTPFAQLIVTQAVYNVMKGERYLVVPDEVKSYALGHFGRLVAPVDENVLDRIVTNGSKAIPLSREPLEPVMPSLRQLYPSASDEERMLRYMFMGSAVDDMKRAAPIDLHYDPRAVSLKHLVSEVAKLSRIGSVSVRSLSFKFDAKRSR